MKKLFTFMLISAIPLCFLMAQEWNISSEDFNSLGTISTTTTVNGLTIYASSEKNVAIDANNKTLDGVTFTHRLKLGGSGDFDENGLPLARVIAFEVDGDAIITIAGMSSSGSEDRELHIAINHEDSILGTFQAMGAEISKGVFNYTGDSATIYLYSPSSGVNIYYLDVEMASGTSTVIREWNISSNDFNALGVLDTITTVNELTIWAHSGKTVEVDANNKTIDDMQFTHRLKLGGSGDFDEDGLALGRVVSFEVQGDALITVAAMSSSSSENRQLHIAVNKEDSILATFPAMGTELTQATYEYTGEPATIYLYSPSSGVNIYYLKVEETIQSPADENVWNMSTETFNALGIIAETTTINGLSIWANSGKTVEVDANNKSLDGMDFTHRLKLGGQGDFDDAGLPLARVVSFEVEGSTRITVMAMSSSSSENRELQLASGHGDSVFATFTALGTELSKGEYVYEGGPATIYLYSSHSGINIYYLKAEEVVTSVNPIEAVKSEIKVYPNPATDKVFVNVTHPIRVAVYNLSGVMVKSKLIESQNDYIDVNDLPAGMYIIRSQLSNEFSRKLIIR